MPGVKKPRGISPAVNTPCKDKRDLLFLCRLTINYKEYKKIDVLNTPGPIQPQKLCRSELYVLHYKADAQYSQQSGNSSISGITLIWEIQIPPVMERPITGSEPQVFGNSLPLDVLSKWLKDSDLVLKLAMF